MDTEEEELSAVDTPEHIHNGHRRKLRDRFISDGLIVFNETEVVEFALSFFVPRQDTNPAAHALMARYGSLKGILRAKVPDMARTAGVGRQAAFFLRFVGELCGYMLRENAFDTRIISPQDAIEVLTPMFQAINNEQFIVLCLDQGGRIIKIHNITDRSMWKVELSLREIMTVVSSVDPAQVIMAHNHMNHCAEPSGADMQLTRRLATIFKHLEVKFIDHIIFAMNGDIFSFHCKGLLDPLITNPA